MKQTHAGRVIHVERIAENTPIVAFAGALYGAARPAVDITCYSITSISSSIVTMAVTSHQRTTITMSR